MGHTQVAKPGPPAHTWGGGASHNQGHPSPHLALPALSSCRETEGRMVVRDTEATVSNKPEGRLEKRTIRSDKEDDI